MVLFCCSVKGCRKKFSSRFSMKRHQLIHQPEKPFQCSYCMKKFILKQYLDEHVYIHTGAKPYVCNYPCCGKAFRQAGKLSLHKKQHKNHTNYTEYIDSIFSHFQLPSWFEEKVLPPPTPFTIPGMNAPLNNLMNGQ